VPAGYECVTLESFPVQVSCYATGCEPIEDGPVTILPAPDETVVVDDPGLVDPPQVDPSEPGIAVGEPVPPTDVCVSPPVDCETDPSVVHCLPIDDPCLPEPDANVRCLPPDCVVSSDGGVDCPAPLPEPCDLEPCAVPGEPGACEGGPAVDCGPVCEPGPAVDCGPVCLDGTDLTPEECARIDPPAQSGGGSDGSSGESTE
jgi:hypothetical protein